MQERLERHQVGIYFISMLLGVLTHPDLSFLFNPALGLMLFVTFLQIPITQLHHAFKNLRFIGALFTTNFVVIPIFVGILSYFLPHQPLIQFAVLFVLLAPCVDYVITFTNLGHGNAKLLLALTPFLLIVQMIAIPFYIQLFLGSNIADIIQIKQFLDALLWFILLPLILAFLTQLTSKVRPKIVQPFNLLPVPATAFVLFIVVSSIIPQIELATSAVLTVLPFYIIYAACAPLLAYIVTRLFKLEHVSARAVLFSSSYRNSLIILPLALSIPNAIPVVPAVILTQTLVELCFLPLYLRIFPKIT